MKRLMPDWPLPEYVFVPGVNNHPKKNGGHMEGQADPVTAPLDISLPEENSFLKFAIDLYNHGYYWESHVYFESLWNAHERKGSTADFFKAMIKLGAAGVKSRIKQGNYANEHFLRAKELFTGVMQNEGQFYLGFDLNDLNQKIDEAVKLHLEKIVLLPLWA